MKIHRHAHDLLPQMVVDRQEDRLLRADKAYLGGKLHLEGRAFLGEGLRQLAGLKELVQRRHHVLDQYQKMVGNLMMLMWSS